MVTTAAPVSTLHGVETRRGGRVGDWCRRGLILLLAIFVTAGLLGLWGVRSETVSASGGGYEVSLTHATVARAGLDVPFEVTVTRAGGLPREITLAVSGDYFDIYETQGFSPEPSAQARDGDSLYLTFDAPPGDTFRFSYDAYIQPSSQQGRSAVLGVVGEDGARVVSIPFRTRLLP